MILLINLCKEKLHYFEFVKPIEDILNLNGLEFFTKSYKKIDKTDLERSNKVIICGTSLKDNDFLESLDKFKWILGYEKPILSICAGMQAICLLFEGKIKNKTEIGFYQERFKKDFLGLIGNREVYHLHNSYASLPLNFESFTHSNIPQAIKHQNRPIYGVLFHPEVRQKDLIKKFCLGDS